MKSGIFLGNEILVRQHYLDEKEYKQYFDSQFERNFKKNIFKSYSCMINFEMLMESRTFAMGSVLDYMSLNM